jgi:hypothetical protein
MSLHDKILNIPCEVDEAKKAIYRIEYKNGHRDARHSAAELISTLTPQEWWSFAPWNYDIDSADKLNNTILLKDESGFVDAAFYFNSIWWRDDVTRFNNPIAWLPLPENK